MSPHRAPLNEKVFMPIQFACACGKALQAKDAFAGRKMRCPQCQQVLTIPSGIVSARAVPEAPPRPAPRVAPRPSQPEALVLNSDDLHEVGSIPSVSSTADAATAVVPVVAVAEVEAAPAPAAHPWASGFLTQHSLPWRGKDAERHARDWGYCERRGLPWWPLLLLLALGLGGTLWFYREPLADRLLQPLPRSPAVGATAKSTNKLESPDLSRTPIAPPQD